PRLLEAIDCDTTIPSKAIVDPGKGCSEGLLGSMRYLGFAANKPTGYGSSSRRAPQTGIVDECCFRSCDLRRLEMYCAPLKPSKSARSVRAQRHTDMPKAQKGSHLVYRSITVINNKTC
uniref:Insulin-like growth factor 1 n=1 Tax=Loxodonta africana TaxID=9785 RepID=G3TG57_LOXAF